MKLLVVLGSVRKGRAGEKVAKWVLDDLEQRSDIDVDFADLAKLELPMEMQETIPAAIKDYQYESPETREWSKRVREAEAILIVTPEYNHSVSAALKNALDQLYSEWEGKPVGLVGYGTRGATDAVKHLEWLAGPLKYLVAEPKVAIPRIWEAFDQQGNLKDEQEHKTNLHAILDALSAS